MHHLIQRLAAVAALLVCVSICSPALAQNPPPPPPPPDQEQEQDQRSRESADRSRPRSDSRRQAATSPVVRQQEGISEVRYVLGGLVGTFYGLGIGHAIAGEYSSTGWIFTLGELGSTAVMVYGISRAVTFDRNGSRDTGIETALAGMLGFTIFRIVEIVDVWTRPQVIDESEQEVFISLGPVDDDGGFGALFQMRW